MAQYLKILQVVILTACASLPILWSATYPANAGDRVPPVVLDGSGGEGGLIQAPDGSIFGATYSGGRTPCAGQWGARPGQYSGCGTIFRIRPDGRADTLYYFRGGQDGAGPQGLGMTPSGDLIGMSWALGDNRYPAKVFKLSPTGAIAVLGAVETPMDHGDLAWDGAEFLGIANDDKFPFYTLSPTGDVKLLAIPAALKARCGVPIPLGDGDEDVSFGPSHGPGGAVYVTTENCVLRLAGHADDIRVVAHSTRFAFVNAPAFDAANNIYVTASFSGASDDGRMGREIEGIVRIDRSGRTTILATLPPPEPDADANYVTGFVMGPDAMLYGIAYLGGRFGAGMLFSVDMTGKLVDLHDFCGAGWAGNSRHRPNGCEEMGTRPFANIMAGRDGTIWGVSDDGVFEFRPKKKSFVHPVLFNGR
jgi:hypothetical protein